ncbi:MAG TPA: hypothetical protein DC049_01855 [Spirochaetia bacterium]|nr:hypothetical protein [Spirochaetia bacterium]
MNKIKFIFIGCALLAPSFESGGGAGKLIFRLNYTAKYDSPALVCPFSRILPGICGQNRQYHCLLYLY